MNRRDPSKVELAPRCSPSTGCAVLLLTRRRHAAVTTASQVVAAVVAVRPSSRSSSNGQQDERERGTDHHGPQRTGMGELKPRCCTATKYSNRTGHHGPGYHLDDRDPRSDDQRWPTRPEFATRRLFPWFGPWFSTQDDAHKGQRLRSSVGQSPSTARDLSINE
jgi:hypothetical protein